MAFYVRKRYLSCAYYTRDLFGLFILGFALYFRTDNFREIIIKLLQVYMTPPAQGKEKKENVNVLELKLTNLNLIVIT